MITVRRLFTAVATAAAFVLTFGGPALADDGFVPSAQGSPIEEDDAARVSLGTTCAGNGTDVFLDIITGPGSFTVTADDGTPPVAWTVADTSSTWTVGPEIVVPEFAVVTVTANGVVAYDGVNVGNPCADYLEHGWDPVEERPVEPAPEATVALAGEIEPAPAPETLPVTGVSTTLLAVVGTLGLAGGGLLLRESRRG